MKVLFLSHSAAGGPYTVGSHQLSRQMVAHGHEVLHLSPPVTPAHLLKLQDPFERTRWHRWRTGGEAVYGVMDGIPASLLPWDLAKLMARPGQRFAQALRPSLKRLLRRHGFEQVDVVLLDEPRLAESLLEVRARANVYRPTDLYAELRGDQAILELEAALVARADVLVATSEPVAEHLRGLGGRDVTVLENGVDLAHFVYATPDAAFESQLPPRPRAIYVGAFDERFGLEWMRAAATANPAVSFLLGGPAHGAIRRQLAMSNVHWLGALAYSEVPRYFATSDVGLLPLSAAPSNQGRSPMKIYEYGASGLPVVATATPELVRRQLSFVSLAQTPADFAASVFHALGKPQTRAPFPEAMEHGWAAKSEQLLALALSRATRRPDPATV